MTIARLVSRSQLPHTPRLAPGRSVLWRSEDSVQLGLAQPDAMVLGELTPALAELVLAMDGTATATRLITDAATAGASPQEAIALIRQLQQAGLVSDDPEPPGPDQSPPAADSAAWSVHARLPAADLLRLRRAASVQVRGSGRIAVAVATALAAAGIGRVQVHAEGRVGHSDVGAGYLPADVGRPRTHAAHDAVARVAPAARTDRPGRAGPDIVVLTDSVGCDPQLTADLVARRIPHLPAHAHERIVMVGPLVIPGRSSCLRCLHLRRAEIDPAWPKLAAQLTRVRPSADLACTQLAAGMAAEQILAVVAGPTSGLSRPPSWGATLELDPVAGGLCRRPWTAHPGCGCGAAPARPRLLPEHEPGCTQRRSRETIAM